MRSLFNTLLSYFLTPGGLLLMGVMDASVVFFLPLGIDFVLIILTARKPELFWLYALLATVGSVIGAGVTFWIGRKLGEHGLARFVKASTLKRVEQRVSHRGAISVAALGVIPPPFPFTAFVLTSGALRLSPWTFLSTLAGVRVVRFMVESALAARYGSGLLTFIQSTTFTAIVIGLAALAIIGTIVSAVAVVRSVRRDKRAARMGRAAA